MGILKSKIIKADKSETFELIGTDAYFAANHEYFLNGRETVSVKGNVMKNKSGRSKWIVVGPHKFPLGYFNRATEQFYNAHRLTITDIDLKLMKVDDVFRVVRATFHYK